MRCEKNQDPMTTTTFMALGCPIPRTKLPCFMNEEHVLQSFPETIILVTSQVEGFLK